MPQIMEGSRLLLHPGGRERHCQSLLEGVGVVGRPSLRVGEDEFVVALEG